MHLKVAICDDELSDVQAVESCLKKYDKAEITIAVFSDAKNLIASYDHAGSFDILFLDVEMPGIDGLSLAKYIRMIPDYNVKIVFISYYPSYMQDSFDVQAHHFLEKPISQERLNKVMDQILHEKNSRAEHKLLISSNIGDHLINPTDLYYVDVDKSSHRDVCFHLSNSVIVSHTSIKAFEKELMSCGFIYVYRSILVNLKHLHTIEKECVLLDNNERLPLSRRYEHEIRQKYINYSINTLNFAD